MAVYRYPTNRKIELVSIGVTNSLYHNLPSIRAFRNVVEVWNRRPVFLDQVSMGAMMRVHVNLTFC